MRRFEIVERPFALGGGWKLTLFEDDQEAGGGVFPPGPDSYQDALDEGDSWIGDGGL
jgi:hypothetical protein